MVIAFHKPYGVLSQFTEEIGSKFRTLAEFGFPKNVYPLGRLDADSEGLLMLTDEPQLNHKLLHPDFNHKRTYLVQIENIPSIENIEILQKGVSIQGYTTLPCFLKQLNSPPEIPERIPPVRFRATIPTSWIELELTEGKNRQVRRMTAAIGHPTLRLIRIKIGDFTLGELPIGAWRIIDRIERQKIFGSGNQ